MRKKILRLFYLYNIKLVKKKYNIFNNQKIQIQNMIVLQNPEIILYIQTLNTVIPLPIIFTILCDYFTYNNCLHDEPYFRTNGNRSKVETIIGLELLTSFC